MDIRVKDPYDDYVSGTPRVILDSNPGGAPPPIRPGDAVVASQVVYNSDGTVSIGIDGNLRTQNNLENLEGLMNNMVMVLIDLNQTIYMRVGTQINYLLVVMVHQLISYEVVWTLIH